MKDEVCEVKKMLKKLGYSEEYIELIEDNTFEQMYEIILSPYPLGANRDDRLISRSPKNGDNIDSGLLMIGSRKVTLPDGEFASLDDFIDAIANLITEKGNDSVVISKKTGKVLSEEDINKLLNIALESGYVFLGDSNERIKNQSSSVVSFGLEDGSSKVATTLMLGKKDDIRRGFYVTEEAIKKAFEEYIIVSKPDETHIVHGKKHSILPIILSALTVASMLSGFKITDEYKTVNDLEVTANRQTVQTIGYNDALSDAYEQIKTGGVASVGYNKTGRVVINPGTATHESSDYNHGGANNSGVLGGVQRPDGFYKIDYFSILYNGKIINVKYEQGISLEDALSESANNLGVSVDSLNAMVHIGGPVSGWIDAKDIINATADSIQEASKKVVLAEQSTAVIKDFDSNDSGYITIYPNGSAVLLKITDENGNLLKPNTQVKGTDGNMYLLTKLEVQTRQENGKKQIIFAFESTKEKMLLASAAADIIYIMIDKKIKTFEGKNGGKNI